MVSVCYIVGHLFLSAAGAVIGTVFELDRYVELALVKQHCLERIFKLASFSPVTLHQSLRTFLDDTKSV